MKTLPALLYAILTISTLSAQENCGLPQASCDLVTQITTALQLRSNEIRQRYSRKVANKTMANFDREVAAYLALHIVENVEFKEKSNRPMSVNKKEGP